MKMMHGMFLANYAFGILACGVAAAFAVCLGYWTIAGMLLFFALFNAGGAYVNYRNLKTHDQENAAKEEG